MTFVPQPHSCPDCDEPMPLTFIETSGLGSWKTGDGYNTEPDTAHYVCFPCAKAWKQRLSGPLTPDVVGEIAFFTCKDTDCGAPLAVTHVSLVPTEVELTCSRGHVFSVEVGDDDALVLVPRAETP